MVKNIDQVQDPLATIKFDELPSPPDFNPEIPSARNFEVGLAEKADHGEDTALIDYEHGIFGVFDGAGGVNGAKEASQLASQVVQEGLSGLDWNAPIDQVEQRLISSLKDAHKAVANNPEAGITTAVVAKFSRDDKLNNRVSWASVGDSRAYVYNRETKELRQITDDETQQNEIKKAALERGETLAEDAYDFMANRIVNAIGSKAGMEVYQYGTITLKANEWVMLCSDGIVGDKGSEVLKPEEIITALSTSASPTEAANNLVKIARKIDDQTAVVIG
jgi:protein phosphatase